VNGHRPECGLQNIPLYFASCSCGLIMKDGIVERAIDPPGVRIFWSDEDESWIAVDDLRPGCNVSGDTMFEALKELGDATIAWDMAKERLEKNTPKTMEEALKRIMDLEFECQHSLEVSGEAILRAERAEVLAEKLAEKAAVIYANLKEERQRVQEERRRLEVANALMETYRGMVSVYEEQMRLELEYPLTIPFWKTTLKRLFLNR
jgi:hypothetical protein